VPIEAGSLHYAVGPVIVFVVLVLLGLFMRWAFGSGGSGRRPRPPAEEGLLTKVATVSSRQTALALRAVLSDAGIRSTLRQPATDDRTTVLVFPEDAARARELAATFTPGEAA
jgi:hypothetical protein